MTRKSAEAVRASALARFPGQCRAPVPRASAGKKSTWSDRGPPYTLSRSSGVRRRGSHREPGCLLVVFAWNGSSFAGSHRARSCLAHSARVRIGALVFGDTGARPLPSRTGSCTTACCLLGEFSGRGQSDGSFVRVDRLDQPRKSAPATSRSGMPVAMTGHLELSICVDMVIFGHLLSCCSAGTEKASYACATPSPSR